MKWSWQIGRIAGIGIYMHATFLILLGWVAVSSYLEKRSLDDAINGLLFVGALFSIVILHELGHALTARRFGIPTRDITLLPIGGVARLERMPDEPMQELLVALAGPAVNVVLAVVLVGIALTLDLLPTLDQAELMGESLLVNLIAVNVLLAVFNLIPAFPMDGGRVLRAVLAMKIDYVKATQIAATIGQAMALLFGIVGLFAHNPFLVFIALFVWMGAAQEAGMVEMRSVMSGIPARNAMITDFQALAPDDPLERAIAYVIAGFQQDFPVVEQGQVVGVLTRADLLTALAQRGAATTVAEVMQREFETADPFEMLENVFARLQSCGCHSLPVVRDGRLVGMMTMDNVSEVLMIQAAIRKSHRRGV